MQGDLFRAKQKDRVRELDARRGTYSHLVTGVDDIKLDDVIDTTLQEREDPYENRIDKYNSSEVRWRRSLIPTKKSSARNRGERPPRYGFKLFLQNPLKMTLGQEKSVS